MTATASIWFVGVVVAGIVSFIGWLIRNRFTKLDDVNNRLTKVETKLDVLGDISTTLHHLRTDVEIIKVQVEKRT